jgi:adenylate cyclase
MMVGQKGWRQDLDRGVEMARDADPMSHAAAASYMYATGVSHGVILVDDADVGEIETALQRAERSSDHAALVLVHLALGIALIHHEPADRERGFDVLAQVRDTRV